MREITIKLQLDTSQNDKNLDISDEMIKEDIRRAEHAIGRDYYYTIQSINIEGDDMNYYMHEYYLKISYHDSKYLQCLIWATESFVKIIQRDNIWEKMLDDDDLILQLRHVFNSLFTAYCILSEDYTDPNYMNIKMEVDDFIIVCEDERIVFDNGETVYISLNPYNYGKWYGV